MNAIFRVERVTRWDRIKGAMMMLIWRIRKACTRTTKPYIVWRIRKAFTRTTKPYIMRVK